MSVVPLRQINAFHNDPKLGHLLLLSLIVHGLIWVAFSFDLFGTTVRPKPPVYYVDLVHKPVLNPQAGRPDPRPVRKPQPEVAKPAPAVQKTTAAKDPIPPAIKPLVKPTAEPAPKSVVKPKPEPKAEPKPVPKAVRKAEPLPEQRAEQKVQSALDEIRDRQKRQAERDALVAKLARLRAPAGAAATIPADVPIGMPDGQGDEAGISAYAFVQTFIQENWALSPYLIAQSRIANIEAKAILTYSAQGRLIGFRIDTPSGNQQFDDSLKRAITKSDQLPQPLPKELELVVIFNLKDIAAARR